MYRDRNGHFCARETAIEQGTYNPTAQEAGGDQNVTPESFGEAHRNTPEEIIYIETGRGITSPVPAGAPFTASVERVAEEAHYGGYFRVFLNGEELTDPDESPETIEPGMRIALTSYDKVGAA